MQNLHRRITTIRASGHAEPERFLPSILITIVISWSGYVRETMHTHISTVHVAVSLPLCVIVFVKKLSLKLIADCGCV